MAGGGQLGCPCRRATCAAEQWTALALVVLAVLLSVVVGTGVAVLTAGRLVTPLTDVARRAARLGLGRLPHLPPPIRHRRTGPGRRRAGLVGAGHRGPDRPGAGPGRRHLPSAADPADRAAVAVGGTRRAPRPAGRRGGAGGAGADRPAGHRGRRSAGQRPVGARARVPARWCWSTSWPRSRRNGRPRLGRGGPVVDGSLPAGRRRARHPGPAAGGDRGAGGELAPARRRARSASPCGRPTRGSGAMVVLEVSDEGPACRRGWSRTSSTGACRRRRPPVSGWGWPGRSSRPTVAGWSCAGRRRRCSRSSWRCGRRRWSEPRPRRRSPARCRRRSGRGAAGGVGRMPPARARPLPPAGRPRAAGGPPVRRRPAGRLGAPAVAVAVGNVRSAASASARAALGIVLRPLPRRSPRPRPPVPGGGSVPPGTPTCGRPRSGTPCRAMVPMMLAEMKFAMVTVNGE